MPILLTNLQALEELILNNYNTEKENDEIYSAITTRCRIIVNHDGEKIKTEKEDTDSLLFTMIKSFPSLKVNGCEIFEDTVEGYLEYANRKDIPFIFVVDHKTIDYDKLSRKVGRCILHSGMRVLPDSLKLQCKFEISKDEHYNCIYNEVQLSGWLNLLKDVILYPSRKLIIQDNYLFSNKNIKYLADNILQLICKFISPGVGFEFSLLILTMNINNNKRDWFEKWISELKKRVYDIAGISIRICIVIHSNKNKIHKRIMISDYTISQSDLGFNTFNSDKPLIDNDIDIRGIFSGLNNKIGDTPLKSMNTALKKIEKTRKEIWNFQNTGIIDPSRMVIGDSM